MALTGLALVLPLGLALAWWLARKQLAGKALVETLVSLPLVLPPVVTGLVLLQLFGRHGVGGWLHRMFGLDVVFTWRAVAAALAAMSLPLLVRAARTAFEEVDGKYEQLARTLGAGEWRVFFTITLPLARRGVLAGCCWRSPARSASSAPRSWWRETSRVGRRRCRWPSMKRWQADEDGHAWTLAAVSAVIAFAAVFLSEKLSRRRK